MIFRLTPKAALLILLAVGPAHQAAAQVYRCNDGDTTVFSDVPCSENTELHQMRSGISVVAAADMDEVARRNQAFVDMRRKGLAARRARAAELAELARRSLQRRAALAEEFRYRKVIGPIASSRFGSGRHSHTQSRVEAQRENTADLDEPERRPTLLSRSGGNQPHILR